MLYKRNLQNSSLVSSNTNINQELMAQYRVVSCTCETVRTPYSIPDYQSTRTLMREKCMIWNFTLCHMGQIILVLNKVTGEKHKMFTNLTQFLIYRISIYYEIAKAQWLYTGLLWVVNGYIRFGVPYIQNIWFIKRLYVCLYVCSEL